MFEVHITYRQGWPPQWVHSNTINLKEGMYNTPSFTLARVIGGIVSWWWIQRCTRRNEEAKKVLIIIIASGFVLGEGACSIINLGLAAARV